jgi:hypothetical protein
MYTLDEKIIQSILRKKFNSFIGTSCETIENLFKEELSKTVSERLIKELLKKNAYNAMREIEEQILAFSKGVNINIQFKRPVSE